MLNIKGLSFAIVATAAAVALAPVDAAAERGKGHGGRGPSFEMLLKDGDANGDEALSREEMKTLGESRFKKADANGDGGLSLDEILAERSRRDQEGKRERLGRMIKKLDDNGDGLIQFEERAARGDKMFDRFDKDGDGVITKAEAAARHHGRKRGDRVD